MILTVFRTQLRADADVASLEKIGERMAQLAAAMPGFISYKDFTSPDGESLTLVEFDSLEHQNAWRDQVEHRHAQHMGREQFFASYRVSVCSIIRESSFTAMERSGGTPPLERAERTG
jgi:heme-degrading monooxygenase HmoA